MSVNRKNPNTTQQPGSSWNENDPQDQNAKSTDQGSGLLGAGFGELFRLGSLNSETRSLPEVPEVFKKLEEHYETQKKSTSSKYQLAFIPTVESMMGALSVVFPGLVLQREIKGTIYVMGVLFARSFLATQSETVRSGQTPLNPYGQTISAPIPSANYGNPRLIGQLKAHYETVGQSKGITSVAIINMIVVDLDMLEHQEAGDVKDRSHNIAKYLANQWEEAIFVKLAKEMTIGQKAIPSPFVNDASPYGKDGCAEARITAISNRVTVGGTLSAANLEIIASTMTNPNNNTSWSLNENSKEICRVNATVSLVASSYAAYMQGLQLRMGNPAAMAGMMMHGQSIYPNGYRPLIPVITMEESKAGEQMANNLGLYSFFYGLYLLMSANNHYAALEAIRKVTVGARGNLSGLETRVAEMLNAIGQFPGRVMLDNKNIADVDVTSRWINQNVQPSAIYQYNIINNGPHSAINNFMNELAGMNNKVEKDTVVATIDGMTKGKFTELVGINVANKTGWNLTKPILIKTNTIVVNGLADHGGKKFNTLEVDEMMLGNLKGKNGLESIRQFLMNQYGIGQDADAHKARSQRMAAEIKQSLVDGNAHINTFGQTCIWDPEFMAVLAAAMDSLGTMNVANSMGRFENNNLVFAPGYGLVTLAAAGSNNQNNAGIGTGFTMHHSFG